MNHVEVANSSSHTTDKTEFELEYIVRRMIIITILVLLMQEQKQRKKGITPGTCSAMCYLLHQTWSPYFTSVSKGRKKKVMVIFHFLSNFGHSSLKRRDGNMQARGGSLTVQLGLINNKSKVRITVRCDISFTVVSNFLFNVNVVQNLHMVSMIWCYAPYHGYYII